MIHTVPPANDQPQEDSGGWRTQAELARAYSKTLEAHEQIGRLKERMRLLVEGSGLEDTLPPGSSKRSHDVPCEPLQETTALAKSVDSKLNLLIGMAGATIAIALAMVVWVVQRIDAVETAATSAAVQAAKVVVLESAHQQQKP